MDPKIVRKSVSFDYGFSRRVLNEYQALCLELAYLLVKALIEVNMTHDTLVTLWVLQVKFSVHNEVIKRSE